MKSECRGGLGINEGRLDDPIARESGARDTVVEILAGGLVAARRKHGGGRGTDEGADLTVVDEFIYSTIKFEARRMILGGGG